MINLSYSTHLCLFLPDTGGHFSVRKIYNKQFKEYFFNTHIKHTQTD